MKLFVANIDQRVTERELDNLFSVCGEVESVKIVKDRATGVPKGFGFIEMPNETEAQTAIDNMNEKEIAGRHLSVVQAKPKSSLH
jgi:RNA recognition motif-containing protein